MVDSRQEWSSPKKKRLVALTKRVFTPDYSDGLPFVIAPALYSDSPETNRPLIQYWVRSVLRTIGYELKPGQTSPELYQLTKISQELVERQKELSLRTLLEDSRKNSPKWTIDETAPIMAEDAKALVSGLGALLGIESELYVGKPFSVEELVSSRKGGLSIIYLVPMPTETRQLIVNWMCEAIYHWMMNTATSGISKRPRLVLFIDEAADYVTQANLSEHKQALFRLLNQGRKYGVSLILAVQTPQGLPPEVSNNCKMKVFGAVDDPGDLDYVRNSTGLVREYLEPLRKARALSARLAPRLKGAAMALHGSVIGGELRLTGRIHREDGKLIVGLAGWMALSNSLYPLWLWGTASR